MSGRIIFACLFAALLLFPPATAFAAEAGGEPAAGTVGSEKAMAASETDPRDGAAADPSSVEPSPTEEPFAEEPPSPGIADPIEPLNRALFAFNDKAYYWVLKPVARGYRAVVPEGVRLSVRNFFSNIGMPVRFVNNLLQGKVRNSGVELLRFAINTTAGIGGLFDPAKNDFHLAPRDEDLGQTFGNFGLRHGLYIVLPLLGPSSLRDAIGLAGDSFLDPVNYVEDTEVLVGAKAFKAENEVSLRIGEYEDLTKSALDPYVAVRDAYSQYRAKKVKE
ncbi:MAG TPA: VacJ family lipoprotein [Candidatus Deferrimicrobiaceae bacterium]|nr:VacJ family lipoprotein [Candidatus Deferrimicrobiaceae bacterium]